MTLLEEPYSRSDWGIQELGHDAATRKILEWRAARPGERILDVGCGTGRFMEAIEKAGAEAVGVEPFLFPLTKAKERVKGFLYRMSAEDLTFSDSSFDKVLCNHVIEHLASPQAAFAEMRRVLKEKGRLLLSYPNSNYLPFRLGLVRQSRSHIQRFTPSLRIPGFVLLKKRVFRLGYNVVMLYEKASET